VIVQACAEPVCNDGVAYRYSRLGGVRALNELDNPGHKLKSESYCLGSISFRSEPGARRSVESAAAYLPLDLKNGACPIYFRATYRQEDARIAVLNECRTAAGTFDQAKGIAHAVEGNRNAKLRVSFFRPFYGDYWILALDPDYRWVLVGEPGRDYAWILARTPQLDAATLEALLAQAASLGFDRQAFQMTPHTQP
jgi:apolipoprotein D and lipocalin family protein